LCGFETARGAKRNEKKRLAGMIRSDDADSRGFCRPATEILELLLGTSGRIDLAREPLGTKIAESLLPDCSKPCLVLRSPRHAGMLIG
jgi:hypothetical protein